MSNSVSVIFFEKVFLFLKFTGTAVQTVQPLLSKGCSCTTSVPLSHFQGSSVYSRGHFGKTETEKWWKNTYGK